MLNQNFKVLLILLLVDRLIKVLLCTQNESSLQKQENVDFRHDLKSAEVGVLVATVLEPNLFIVETFCLALISPKSCVSSIYI